jgi:hypothetical protein
MILTKEATGFLWEEYIPLSRVGRNNKDIVGKEREES